MHDFTIWWIHTISINRKKSSVHPLLKLGFSWVRFVYRYMNAMELGVLSDMPDIRKKACWKLFKQQVGLSDPVSFGGIYLGCELN